MSDQKYIKQGDIVYFVNKETTKEKLIKEYDDRLNNIDSWKIKAIQRIEEDFIQQQSQLIREKQEIEKL